MTGSATFCRGRRKRFGGLAAIPVVLSLLAVSRTDAQTTVRVSVEENLRREPRGQILGRLDRGTPLSRVSTDGPWSEVTLEGWVWTASLQTTEREGFDLVVSADGGENVRTGPSGGILGRLDEDTLLEEVERVPGWTRVRRTAWMWSASLTATAAASGAGAPAAPPTSGRSAPSSAPAGDRFLRPGASTPILSTPDGDTVAVSSGSGDLEVLAREGGWLRVRLEGWVWRPAAGSETEDLAEGPGEDVTPEMLAGPEGEAYEGRRVTWRVQFISLERAEAIRSDFFEGEPFILGRVGGGDGPFVYVAVPPERVPAVEGLTPLEVVTVTGRVRRASSALTRSPILDLLGLERGPGS